jgi:hypothetical protein
MKSVYVFLAVLLTACGSPSTTKRSIFSGLVGQTEQEGDASARKNSVTISLFEGEGGFGLRSEAVTGFKLALTCDDFSEVITASPYALVGDLTGCSAVLQEFTFAQKLFTRVNAELYSAQDGSQAYVRALSSLPTSITGNVSLSYSISIINRGTDTNVQVNQVLIGASGELAPNYRLAAAGVTGGRLQLNFECGTAVASGKCDTDAITNVEIIAEPLVKNIDIKFVDSEFLTKAFKAGGKLITAYDNAVIAPGTRGLKNGGFLVKLPIVDTGSRLPYGLGEAYIVSLRHAGKDSYFLTKLVFKFNQ